MAALTDLSDLVNRISGGNNGTPEAPKVFVDSRVAGAAAQALVISRMSSLWTWNKAGSTRGAAPTTVAAPTAATQGALPFTNPGGGRQKWLLGIDIMGSTLGTIILYDRLLHVGNLDGTVITAQTVGGTLTRNTGGIGNEIWVEIYNTIGATSRTITASYTNQAGSSGQTSQASPIGNTGLREIDRILPIPLADGDTGVQAVASVTLSATTGTAGTFGITVVKRIATISCPQSSVSQVKSLISDFPSMPELVANSCLSLALLAGSTAAPQFWFDYSMVEA